MSLLAHLPAVDLGAGSLAVVYRTASYVWGRYTATYPEDHDTEHLELEDNREYGYVAKLTDAEPERFGRTFTRADVHADAVLQVSDVERKIDEAAVVTDGDTVVRREIGEDGLNGLVPYVDFQIGDIIPCRSWGKLLYLPVISITVQSSPGGVLEYRVMVGSRLVSDRAELEQVTAEIDQRVAKDKEELRKRIERERAQRIRADKRETRLRENALSEEQRKRVEQLREETAARESSVESLRGALTGAGGAQADLVAALEGLNRQLRRTGSDPAPGLIPAYLQMNTELWQMQQEVNNALRKADDALIEGQEANRELIKMQQALAEMNENRIDQINRDNEIRDELVERLQEAERQRLAQRWFLFSLSEGQNEHWSYSHTGAENAAGTLTARGSWNGRVQALTTRLRHDSRGDERWVIEPWSNTVPKATGGRSYSVEIGGYPGMIWYQISPGQARSIDMRRRGYTPESSVWSEIDAMNIQSNAVHTITARVEWRAVHRGSEYRFRVRSREHGELLSWSSGTKFGPVWPWENGARSVDANPVQRRFSPGDRIFFEVWSSAPTLNSRTVNEARSRVYWID